MIQREDMLELTRRMTVKRTSFTRIAGSYMDEDGEIDGTFNVNFLNLSLKEREKNLAIAKAIPFSTTNVELKDFTIPANCQGNGSMWQLLMAIKQCGLKNDALMDIFYELTTEHIHTNGSYAIIVFHDRYDVPVKAADKERLGESEEVYEYLICAVCPLAGEYEPGRPECGFLFPAFADRSTEMNQALIFSAGDGEVHRKELQNLLCGIGVV
ncbi:MAG: DUF4317 family protein [Lachnospiraceae bacterium]|nr:DUF4317 family protein [Lachnospiraceae bacterium]